MADDCSFGRDMKPLYFGQALPLNACGVFMCPVWALPLVTSPLGNERTGFVGGGGVGCWVDSGR